MLYSYYDITAGEMSKSPSTIHVQGEPIPSRQAQYARAATESFAQPIVVQPLPSPQTAWPAPQQPQAQAQRQWQASGRQVVLQQQALGGFTLPGQGGGGYNAPGQVGSVNVNVQLPPGYAGGTIHLQMTDSTRSTGGAPAPPMGAPPGKSCTNRQGAALAPLM